MDTALSAVADSAQKAQASAQEGFYNPPNTPQKPFQHVRRSEAGAWRTPLEAFENSREALLGRNAWSYLEPLFQSCAGLLGGPRRSQYLSAGK